MGKSLAVQDLLHNNEDIGSGRLWGTYLNPSSHLEEGLRD